MTVAPIGKNHRLSRLLLKQPDVRYVNYIIVLTPIRHLVCEITIYEQAQQSGFMGAWSVYGLWSLDAPPELEGFVGAGIPIQKSGPMTVMAVVPPTSYDVFLEQVEAEILPYLRTLNSMEKLYAESMRRRQELMSDSPDTQFQLKLVMGHFDVALQLPAATGRRGLTNPSTISTRRISAMSANFAGCLKRTTVLAWRRFSISAKQTTSEDANSHGFGSGRPFHSKLARPTDCNGRPRN